MAMTKNKKRSAAIAAYQAAHPGSSHTAAVFAVRAHTATLAPGRRIGDPEDLDDLELGIEALLADATASQRAFAESHWRSTSEDQPCRCSGNGEGGPCSHGKPCDLYEEPCGGVWIHADRFPGGLWHLTLWHDVYVCSVCEEVGEADVELPDVPWGEKPDPEGPTIVFDDVRHPNFSPEFWDEDEDEDTFDREENCDCGADHEYHCVCR
jgi:hypothetical protein